MSSIKGADAYTPPHMLWYAHPMSSIKGVYPYCIHVLALMHWLVDEVWTPHDTTCHALPHMLWYTHPMSSIKGVDPYMHTCLRCLGAYALASGRGVHTTPPHMP